MNNQNTSSDKKQIIIAEDDNLIIDIINNILSKYSDEIEKTTVNNAADLIAILKKSSKNDSIDAIILDLMMPYGSERPLLDPEESDIDENNTGLNILWCIRNGQLKNDVAPKWISVITARSSFAVDAKANNLLGSQGKIYYKPFDSFEFEDDLMHAIGIQSKVPSSLLMNNIDDFNDDEDI